MHATSSQAVSISLQTPSQESASIEGMCNWDSEWRTNGDTGNFIEDSSKCSENDGERKDGRNSGKSSMDSQLTPNKHDKFLMANSIANLRRTKKPNYFEEFGAVETTRSRRGHLREEELIRRVKPNKVVKNASRNKARFSGVCAITTSIATTRLPSLDERFPDVCAIKTSTAGMSCIPSLNDRLNWTMSVGQSGSDVTRTETTRISGKTISSNVRSLLSFAGCEDMLRACRLTFMMQKLSCVFGESSGNEDTFNMSDRVHQIGAFVSHNWCVPRWQKHMCLSLHFNTFLATVFAYSVALFIGLLTFYHLVPMFDGYGFLCTVLCVPIQLLLMIVLRDIPGCRAFYNPYVFLDKVCIDQSDPILMRVSIERLGAFLTYSDKMVILYTDIYLTRLWTVYEIASFLALHPVDDIEIVPTTMPLMVVLGMLSYYATAVLSRFLSAAVAADLLYFGVPILGVLVRCVCFLFLLRFYRIWARSLNGIGQRLAWFSVRQTDCTVESDRQVVYDNIAKLVRGLGRLPKDVSEEVLLELFDEMVQKELPSALVASLGNFGLRYDQMLMMSAGYIIPQLLDQLSLLRDNNSVAAVSFGFFLGEVGVSAANMLVIQPIVLASYGTIVSKHIQMRGWKEQLWFLFGVILIAQLEIIMQCFFHLLKRLSQRQDVSSMFKPISTAELLREDKNWCSDGGDVVECWRGWPVIFVMIIILSSLLAFLLAKGKLNVMRAPAITGTHSRRVLGAKQVARRGRAISLSGFRWKTLQSSTSNFQEDAQSARREERDKE